MDVLRSLAILAVVFIHSAAWAVPTTLPELAGPVAALVGLSRFCVPAFVLVSGMLLLIHHRHRPLRSLGFLTRRGVRVLMPWLAWVPVLFLLGLAGGDFQGPGDAGAWLAHGGGMYFLLLIGQFYAVFLVFARLRGRRALLAVAATSVVVQLGLGWARTYGPLPRSGAAGWLWSELAYEEFPFYLGYFALGCVAGAEWGRLRTLERWWPVAAAAATVGAGLLLAQSLTVGAGPSRREANVFIWPAMLPYTAALALAVLWTARALGPHLRWSMPLWSWLGRYSLGIYVLHQVALRYLGPLVREWPDPALIVALSLASLAVAAAVVAVLRRSRWTAIWLGESPGVRLASLRRATG